MSRFISIISIVLVLVFILGGYLVCWPKYQLYSQQTQILQEDNKKLAEKDSYYSQLKSIFGKISVHQEEIAKIDSALPPQVSFPALLNFFQKTAQKGALIMKDVTFSKNTVLSASNSGDKTKKERIKKHDISFSLVGSYSAFKNFLSDVYQSSRLIEVKSIRFTSFSSSKNLSLPNNSANNLFKFDVSLETYSLPNPELGIRN